MSREQVIVDLMFITTLNVGLATVVVFANAVSSLGMRFNLSFLAGTILLCATNISIYYGWL